MPPTVSPRRQSRLRPHLVNIERATAYRNGATVEETFEAVLLSEPASIQVRTRSSLLEETGLVLKRTFVGFFDKAADVRVGDHVVYGDAIFLVTDVSPKPAFVDVRLEQLVIS